MNIHNPIHEIIPQQNNKIIAKKGSNLNRILRILDNEKPKNSNKIIIKTDSSSINAMNNLKTQCGGHKGIRQGTKGKYAYIAKPISTDREALFYKTIKVTPLYQCVPKYLGISKDSNNNSSNSKSWLLLQDLTLNMSSPCIADLKIGTRTFEIDVPQWKQERQLSLLNGTTTISHAVRCIDICIRHNNTIIEQWDRRQGRRMKWSDFEKALRVFLSTKAHVEQFTEQLKFLRSKLVETYQEYLPNMRLYSASVLIIYDGDKDNSPLTLKLIDFGHGYTDLASEGGNPHDPSYDDNALLGIDNLLSIAASISTTFL